VLCLRTLLSSGSKAREHRRVTRLALPIDPGGDKTRADLAGWIVERV
jgi:hypothetical protein